MVSFARPAAEREASVVIEVSDLTVRFGGVTPLDGMTVTFERRHVRADRAQRRRQDHVLQRAERVRQASLRPDHRLRRGPAEDGPLPACALGRPAHLPDRAGDRGAVGLRQRGDDPRALEGDRRLPGARTCSGAIDFVKLDVDPYAKVDTLGAAATPAGRGGARGGRQAPAGAARRARRRTARRGDRRCSAT